MILMLIKFKLYIQLNKFFCYAKPQNHAAADALYGSSRARANSAKHTLFVGKHLAYLGFVAIAKNTNVLN